MWRVWGEYRRGTAALVGPGPAAAEGLRAVREEIGERVLPDGPGLRSDRGWPMKVDAQIVGGPHDGEMLRIDTNPAITYPKFDAAKYDMTAETTTYTIEHDPEKDRWWLKYQPDATS